MKEKFINSTLNRCNYTQSVMIRFIAIGLSVVSLVACNDSDTSVISATSDTHQLTVPASEHGQVSISPDSSEYNDGTTVTLTATAESGYVFTGWSGDSTSVDASITLMMDEDKTVEATFERGVIIELAESENGQYTVEPPITSGTTVPFGTEFTITAVPDNGYVLDSIYKMLWVMEPGWSDYVDESFTSPHTIETDANDARFKIFGGEMDKYVIGASFTAEDTWGELHETLNVVYATPGSKSLKYDIYTPLGAIDLPIVIIVHGGAWSLNSEDIMRGQARYIAQTGRYVVASIDYRLLIDLDEPAPTKSDMVNDVYGAIAHIQENAEVYGGDPQRIIITGDSAGGHLSASAALLTRYIGDQGYTGEIGTSQFMPSYIPSSMSVDDFRSSIQSSLIAVAPSYGAFISTDGLGEMEPAVEPISNIPLASEWELPPHYLQVGSDDTTVGPEGVRQYAAALEAADQQVQFVEYPGVGHAYFDWKPEERVLETFNTVGKPALDQMIDFFDTVVTANNTQS